MPARNYREIFEKFHQLRVMVIGDVMVDAYLFGRVDRISPEAPVPVVQVEKRTSRLGGAANVALNLKALGAEPVLCSMIGDDQKGREFIQLIREENIGADAILTSKNRITTTKFRVIGNNTQMLRVDEEMTADLEEQDERRLLSRISEIIAQTPIHAIVLQDYNKGILTEKLIREVVRLANQQDIPVSVDPKKRNFLGFSGVTLFKPNLKELREGLNREVTADDAGSLVDAARYFHFNQDIRMVMVTLSDKGVFISRKMQDDLMQHHLIPAVVRNIADVSGAGDTVISVAALCQACGLEPEEIAAISNIAGGLVCEEVGVVPVNRDKLLAEVAGWSPF